MFCAWHGRDDRRPVWPGVLDGGLGVLRLSDNSTLSGGDDCTGRVHNPTAPASKKRQHKESPITWIKRLIVPQGPLDRHEQ